MLESSLCGTCLTSHFGALNFQVTVTGASVYGRRTGVRLHFEATLTLPYTATFNQTRTAPLLICHGEETEFCVVFVEGTATLKLSVFLRLCGFLLCAFDLS